MLWRPYPTGDAASMAVRAPRAFAIENLRLGHQLQETKADKRGRDPRRYGRIAAQRAIVEPGNAVGGPAQLDDLTATERDRNLIVGDHHPSFAPMAWYRERL